MIILSTIHKSHLIDDNKSMVDFQFTKSKDNLGIKWKIKVQPIGS